MSLSSKQLRELEAKLNDKLYDNLKLLTHFYPPTKEFNEIFKRNMFSKNNKAAFQHVIYYLFSVFNPQLVKEKITWPLYDVKLESTFRNEVIAFINYINSEFEYANIPNLMASHLMSPGGLKFLKFILKVSVFVMHEVLKKDEEIALELLTPIKPHKDSNLNSLILKNLKVKISCEEGKIENLIKKFEETHQKALRDADRIVGEQTQVEKDLYNVNKALKERKEKNVGFESVELLTQKLDTIREQMTEMGRIKQLAQQGNELLTYLSSDKPVLEFEKENFVVSDCVKHFFNTEKKLDLIRLFDSLSIVLDNKCLEMPVFTESQLNEMISFFSGLNVKYCHLDQKLSGQKSELEELAESFPGEGLEGSKGKKPIIVLTRPKEDSI